MTPGFKIAAAYGLPAAVGVAGIEVIALALQGSTMSPVTEVVGGGATGGVLVGAVAWALYKAKVDAHDAAIRDIHNKKADRDVVTAIEKHLDELHKDVREIRDTLRGN